jgi:phosphohistidine phosphatase
MVRLLVLRHAKAAIATPGMKDFDRGLTARGVDDASALADVMRKQGYLPQKIACSPSRRTRMTLHGVMRAFDDAHAPVVDYVDELYSGEPSDYLTVARGFGDTSTAMIIGHNPMCEVFSSAMSERGKDKARSGLHEKFPTCALAVIDFDAKNWSEIAATNAYLADFLLPPD